MRFLPEMPNAGGPETHRLHHAFVRDELFCRALCGGLDVDVVLERLFDGLSERRT